MSLGAFQSFISKHLYWLSLPTISLSDIMEIIIISAIIYQALKWVQLTRAWMLVKGIMILLLFALAAAVLQLNTISWLLANSLGVGITAVLIIFQPELRRALEQLGRNNFLKSIVNGRDSGKDYEKARQRTINEICKAAAEMSKAKTGALIVMEQKVALGEYERTGIAIDAVVSSQLLVNIFEHNTPLHDGAVIIRENRIVSATCYLPLSDNMDIGKELGTRHRAALGVSEVSDGIIIIVSEETGAISVACEGKLSRDLDKEGLKRYLSKDEAAGSGQSAVINKWKGLLRNEKANNQ